MKKIFFLLVLTVCYYLGFAVTVQTNEAKTIALNWLNSLGGNYFEMGDVGTVYSKIENKVPIYYIVTFKPSGWVIVSGSDIAEPILGFSTNTQFDLNQMPPQVEGWMSGISGEIEKAVKNKLLPSLDIRQKWQTYRGKIIKKQDLKSTQTTLAGPLLTSTWGQGKYYNEMAPSDATSTAGNGHVWLGCVATAMVQVLKFWEYPESGMGSHSYTDDKYGIQSANFANSTYNWSAMPDNVTSLNTEVQKIGYHCAVSVNMDFSPTSSGAYLSSSVFSDYFKYNSTAFEASKARWDDQEWKAQLKRDIDAGRPVLYSGYNASYTTGHAWVCDGYSGEYFHFNWGWNGSYNGNFLLSSLTPGSSNYSNDQSALFSIEPVFPASIRIPYVEGFESPVSNGISLMGVNQITSEQSHTGTGSLRLGKESIVSYATDAASLCFLVPSESELNFWVKRYTPVVSENNQQKAYIMPQYGSTPLIEIYNGDFNDHDWVSYNVNLSAYAGQIVRLLFVQEVKDFVKQQWMYIDDISISGISNNLAPYTPSNPIPSNLANFVVLNPTLHWSGGDPNGDDMIYNVYLGTSTDPPLVGSVFSNNYTPPQLDYSTTFYWKIIANDGNLSTEGPVWSFTTKGIPPTVGNCGVSKLTSTSVSICGKILNYNKSTVSSRGICWNKTSNPTHFDNFIETTEPTDVFSCEISGLQPYSKYYYSAFANSDQGISYSDVLDFTTLSDLPVVSVGKVENILRSSASVTGVINAVNDSMIFRRGVVWSTNFNFDPSTGHVVSEEGSWKNPGNFIINLINLPGPGNIFFRVFTVNSVGISYSDESVYIAQNHAPLVDLDLNNSKGAVGINNYRGTCTEQLPGGNICDTDVEISDPDGDTIKQVKVTLMNAYNAGSEFVTVLSNNENLNVAGDKTGQLTITTSKSLSYTDWKEVLRSIEYRNNLDSPHPEIIRQIQVQVSDGFDSSNVATAFITIIPVNDPPVNQILPSLDTIPVFNSRVKVKRGSWADILDSCNGIFDYSYKWQLKNSNEEIIDLSYDDQQILPIGEDLCGSSIRVIEKVTDKNCGGSNVAVAQAVSEWYKVGQITQTITIDPIADHYYNEAFFTFKGRATSGLPISYKAPSNKYISISNDTAFIRNTGTVVISGIQPGNECYLPSQLLNRIVTIKKSKQSIVYEKKVEAKYDERRIKIPASATSGLGLFVVSSDSSVAYVENDTIDIKGIGKNTLTIYQPGNQNYFPSDTVKINLTVLKGDQLITTQFPNDLVYGKGRLPFRAISSALLDVELSSSDTSVIKIVGDSLIIDGVGEVMITAKQPGNNLWNPAKDVEVTLDVKKGTQKIYVDTLINKEIIESSFRPDFNSSSGLEVNFSIRDTSIAYIVNSKIVLKNVGETYIDFMQNGNQLWEPASNKTLLKVVKANQSVTFNKIENQHFGVSAIVLKAYSNSGLKVFFNSSNQEVAAISGDTLYIHNAGTAEISASQPGNKQYNPAIPVSVNLLVEKANQSIISNLPDSMIFDNQIIYADVKSTSGLIVDIASSDDRIVKVVSDSLQVNGPGDVILRLTQQGNQNYLPAETSVKMVITEKEDIFSLENAHFSIFPNPTEGKANLIVNGNINYPLQVSIVNSTGKTIKDFETLNPINYINLSNQPQGLYFVVVRYQKGSIAQKLLIAH